MHTNTQQPVKCYYKLTHTHTQTHTVANSGGTGEFMYAAETLTALSVCGRYTKCSLPLVSSQHPKTNLLLCLYSQFMLSCSLVLKGKQTSLSFACIFLLIQTRKKSKSGGCCRHTGTRRLPVQGIKPHPYAGGLIKDYRRQTHKFGVAF